MRCAVWRCDDRIAVLAVQSLTVIRHANHILIAAVILAAWPSIAHANAGTALAWASMLHLLFGNLLLGVLEGFLLVGLFNCRHRTAILNLIAANYVSAFIGLLVLARAPLILLPVTIETLWIWMLICIGLFFVVTVLIEYPFVFRALKGKPNRARKALVGAVFIHVFSYSLLVAWYGYTSDTSLITELDVVPIDQMDLPLDHDLYYINRDGAQIIRCQLDGSSPQTYFEFEDQGANRLFAYPADDGTYNLYARYGEQSDHMLVRADYSSQAPTYDSYQEKWVMNIDDAARMRNGLVPKLIKSDRSFTADAPGYLGLHGERENSHWRFRIVLESPFVLWKFRNATQIKGDLVVFQLSDDQICIVDPNTKQIALIARGKGPLVAMSNESSPQPQPPREP